MPFWSALLVAAGQSSPARRALHSRARDPGRTGPTRPGRRRRSGSSSSASLPRPSLVADKRKPSCRRVGGLRSSAGAWTGIRQSPITKPPSEPRDPRRVERSCGACGRRSTFDGHGGERCPRCQSDRDLVRRERFYQLVEIALDEPTVYGLARPVLSLRGLPSLSVHASLGISAPRVRLVL